MALSIFKRNKKENKNKESLVNAQAFLGAEEEIYFQEEKIAYTQRIFAEKMMFANPKIKNWYSQIKSLLTGYEGVKSKISRRADTFVFKGDKVAMITLSGKTLKLRLALNISDAQEKFHCNVNDKGAYAKVPLELRVTSARALGYALELINVLSEKFSLKKDANAVKCDAIGEIEKYLINWDLRARERESEE